MATLIPENFTSNGLAPSYVPADVAGDEFNNSSGSAKRVLHVKNGGGSPINVSPQITTLVDGQAVVQKQIVVAAGADIFIGPFNAADYGTLVTVQYSGVTSVTVALLST